MTPPKKKKKNNFIELPLFIATIEDINGRPYKKIKKQYNVCVKEDSVDAVFPIEYFDEHISDDNLNNVTKNCSAIYLNNYKNLLYIYKSYDNLIKLFDIKNIRKKNIDITDGIKSICIGDNAFELKTPIPYDMAKSAGFIDDRAIKLIEKRKKQQEEDEYYRLHKDDFFSNY